eukprot:COSAG01_NODE_1814_length_9172_cov_220.138212_9_plen_88_part_00
MSPRAATRVTAPSLPTPRRPAGFLVKRSLRALRQPRGLAGGARRRAAPAAARALGPPRAPDLLRGAPGPYYGWGRVKIMGSIIIRTD